MSGIGSRSRPLSVEFFGLPAVGKSELSRQLGRRLARDGVAVAQPSYDLAHGIGRWARARRKGLAVAGLALRDPRASWRALAAAWATGPQPSALARAKLVFNWLLVTALARRAHVPGTVMLFDQGLFQGLWSFGLEGDLERVEELIAGLPGLVRLPDYLVVSQASRITLEERVRARPGSDSRLDVAPELLSQGLATLARLCARVARDLDPDRPQLVFLTNETAADLERNVTVLAALLEQRLRADRGEGRAQDPTVLASES